MTEQEFNSIVVDIDYYNHRICTPSWIIEERVNRFVDLTYVVAGKAEYTIDGVCHTVRRRPDMRQKGCRVCGRGPDDLMDCWHQRVYL